MADDGLIAGSRRKLQRPGVLPSVTVLEIVERDSYGEFIARPANWPEEHGPPPRILIIESKQDKGPAAGIGDRVLARITPLGPDADTLPGAADQAASPRQAKPARHLPRPSRRRRCHRSRRPQAAERVAVARGATNDAENGELVRFELGGPAASAAPGPRHSTGSAIRKISGRQPHRHACPRHSRRLSRRPCCARRGGEGARR